MVWQEMLEAVDHIHAHRIVHGKNNLHFYAFLISYHSIYPFCFICFVLCEAAVLRLPSICLSASLLSKVTRRGGGQTPISYCTLYRLRKIWIEMKWVLIWSVSENSQAATDLIEMKGVACQSRVGLMRLIRLMGAISECLLHCFMLPILLTFITTN